MKKLKLISLLLAGSMMCAALFACGEDGGAAAPAADTTAAEVETTTEAETEPPIETELKTNKTLKVAAGSTAPITIRLKMDPSKDAPLAFSSSDEAIAKAASATATVGDDGKTELEITGVASGSATISVSTSDGVTASTAGTVYTEQIVYEIAFTDPSAKYFKNFNSIDKNLVVENGVLKGTITGGDPFMSYADGKMGLNLADIQIVRFYIKIAAADANMQMFFTTDSVGGYNEQASLKATGTPDAADFEIVDMDPSESPDWTGTLKGFRFDPSSAESGTFEIQKIQFIKMG